MSAPSRHALACQNDPERWFDKHNRSYALEHCLACPRRSWCAGEALNGASYGMWAGIWIDGNLTEVSDYLRAIAHTPPDIAPPTDRPSPTPSHTPPATGTTPPPVATATPDPHPPRSSADENPTRSIMSVIIARSSGHCEVMTPVCRYTFDTLGSRIPSQSAREAQDASTAYAVCRPCQWALSIAEPQLIRRLGYIVDPPRNPAFAPVYWRQAHWVYLDGGATVLDVYGNPGITPQRGLWSDHGQAG